MEELKPQGLYPSIDKASNRASKRKIQPRKDLTRVFLKPVNIPKDEAVEQHSPGMT